jgi:hypothetical protein
VAVVVVANKWQRCCSRQTVMAAVEMVVAKTVADYQWRWRFSMAMVAAVVVAVVVAAGSKKATGSKATRSKKAVAGSKKTMARAMPLRSHRRVARLRFSMVVVAPVVVAVLVEMVVAKTMARAMPLLIRSRGRVEPPRHSPAYAIVIAQIVKRRPKQRYSRR